MTTWIEMSWIDVVARNSVLHILIMRGVLLILMLVLVLILVLRMWWLARHAGGRRRNRHLVAHGALSMVLRSRRTLLSTLLGMVPHHHQRSHGEPPSPVEF